MNKQRIAELRELCERATAGLWETYKKEVWLIEYQRLCTCKHKADADFIAAARTALPEALDEIERLQEEISRVSVFLATHNFPGYEFVEGEESE